MPVVRSCLPNTGRTMPLHLDRREPHADDLAGDDAALAALGRVVLEDQGARCRVDAQREQRLGGGRRRPTRGSRGARWSPGARSSRRCRSSRRGGRRAGRRGGRRTTPGAPRDRRGGHRRRRCRLVIVGAMSGGKSSRAQSTLIPMPTTTRGSSVPRPSLSPSTPASLRSSSGAARRARAAFGVRSPARSALGPPVSTTRSLGHFMRTAPTGRPAVSSAASHIASAAVPARRQARSGASQVGRKPSEQQQRGAGGRGPGPAVAAPALGLLVRDGEADLRGCVQQPRADDVVRAADGREPLEAAELAPRGDGVGHRAVQPAPVPAASTVSGCSSSNAAWSDRTASSTRSSEMMVVIRISDVEIISMLIPASASVPNMRAA